MEIDGEREGRRDRKETERKREKEIKGERRGEREVCERKTEEKGVSVCEREVDE